MLVRFVTLNYAKPWLCLCPQALHKWVYYYYVKSCDILHYIVSSIFITAFFKTTCVFKNTEIIGLYTRAVRLIEIEIKSRFEIARFLNRFIARFFSAPRPNLRSMLSEPIRMQQNRTDRAYRQIGC